MRDLVGTHNKQGREKEEALEVNTYILSAITAGERSHHFEKLYQISSSDRGMRKGKSLRVSLPGQQVRNEAKKWGGGIILKGLLGMPWGLTDRTGGGKGGADTLCGGFRC